MFGSWLQLSFVQVAQPVIFRLPDQPLQKFVLLNVQPWPNPRKPVSVPFGCFRHPLIRKHLNSVSIPGNNVGLSSMNRACIWLTNCTVQFTGGPIRSHLAKLTVLKQSPQTSDQPLPISVPSTTSAHTVIDSSFPITERAQLTDGHELPYRWKKWLDDDDDVSCNNTMLQ
uniref:Putative secreted protein n=1 Tax=Anopheles triannulatus TaxID=58253 RepID=A0A2M4B163_9DIPT